MSVWKFIVLLVYVPFITTELPPVEKCSLSDSSCLKKSAQLAVPVFTAGMPEIGIESLDPMKIKMITINLAGLDLNVDNVAVTGLKKAVISKLSINMAKKQMQVAWESDIVMKGHYVASGRLIILPISGDGDYDMRLKKLRVQMTINFEVSKNEDGKEILDLQNHRYNFQVKENAHFALTNLFNGNKALSDALLNFMNTNWQTLAKEFGDAMLKEPAKKVFEAIKAYLKSQPLEDITN